jgi:nucleotide-binding universal stress UspA family protein
MNILVGYDGSDAARQALVKAQKHAAAFEVTLDVVTVIVRYSNDQSDEIAHAEKLLEAVQKDCDGKSIACKTHLLIREYSPGESLVEFALENAFEELIIGVRKRSRVGKLLLGSNTQFVILNSPCPVLTVKASE